MVKEFARRLMNMHGISAAATHKGKNFQTNNEQHEYTNDDVRKSDAAATLKTKIAKAKTAGARTRINPIEDPNAAARAADEAATTISTGTKKLRRLNKTNEDTISEEGKFPSTGRAGRMSRLALKRMGQHNNEKSPETAKKFRGSLAASSKRDAIRNARKARKV